jgi:hypothetical protein
MRGSREQSGAPRQPAATQGHGFSAGLGSGGGYPAGSGRLDAGFSTTHAGTHPAHGRPIGFLAAAQHCPTARAQAADNPDKHSATTKIRSHTAQGGAQGAAAGQSADQRPAFGARRTDCARSPGHHVPDAGCGDTCR